MNFSFSFLNNFLEHTVSVKMLILIGILYYILFISMIHGCCKRNSIGSLEGMENKTIQPPPKPVVPPSSVQSTTGKKKEGFVGANTNFGESSSYSLAHAEPVDTSKWGAPTLTVSGNKVSPAAQAIINRPNQSFPLPEGQLSMFDNMPFSPECCPNTYSSSMGCACMNSDTYNYLITRGGNNQPYSEY